MFSVIALGLGCAVLPLPGQAERPIDEVQDLPHPVRPLGVIVDFPVVESERSVADWQKAEMLLREAVEEKWDESFRDDLARHPLVREWLSETGPRWQLGVVLEPSAASSDGPVKIARVRPGSPAEKAGLQAGDMVAEVNALKIRDVEMLIELIQVIRDQEVVLTVIREGERKKVRVTPERTGSAAPVPDAKSPKVPEVRPAPDPKWGPPLVDPLNRIEPAPQAEGPLMQQLHQDNKEMQALLRELIEEVKKLQRDE